VFYYLRKLGEHWRGSFIIFRGIFMPFLPIKHPVSVHFVSYYLGMIHAYYWRTIFSPNISRTSRSSNTSAPKFHSYSPGWFRKLHYCTTVSYQSRRLVIKWLLTRYPLSQRFLWCCIIFRVTLSLCLLGHIIKYTYSFPSMLLSLNSKTSLEANCRQLPFVVGNG